jgi:hypothetical protein
MMDEQHPRPTAELPSWLSSNDYIVFGGRPRPVPGSSEDHALADWFEGLIPRKKEEVKQDWHRVMGQIQELLQDVSLVPANFQLDEVVFELGFSAQGKIVFVAEAGVDATVSVTFKRNSSAAGPD